MLVVSPDSWGFGSYLDFSDDVTAATSVRFISLYIIFSEVKTSLFPLLCFFPSLSYILANSSAPRPCSSSAFAP